MFGYGISWYVGMSDYRSRPTERLVAMWEAGVNAVMGRDPSELTIGDYDAIWEMRRELDRRRDERKPVVDVNFSEDYLTD